MNIAGHFPDDEEFRQVQAGLLRFGFHCERFVAEAALLRAMSRRPFDFVLIDLGNRVHANDTLFSWLACRVGECTPVLVISSVRDPELSASALNAGADDFLSRPFEPVEIAARINAIMRRCQRRQTRRIIEFAGFTLRQDSGQVSFEGAPIELTPREFTMAWLLFSTPGEYVTRETMSTTIWGMDSEIASRTIEQHVYKLRRKMQLVPERGLIIRTAYNRGYRLEYSGDR